MSKLDIQADIPQEVNYVNCTVNVGTTETLPPGSDAAVTNSGTESHAILNFGIPKGVDGVDGTDGENGKSAYQQAVDGGYEGTEDEFEQALASDIATVADNISDINAVGQSIADVNAVADTLSDVSVVANIATEVSTVSGISADVAQVSSISSAVSNVADNNTNITTVASDLTNIDTAATNIAAIIAAPTAATNAATSATNAQTWAEGTDSAITPLGGEHSAKGWANIAKQYAESIGAAIKYKGSVSTYSALPATGQEIGDMWNVLDTGKNYAWTGTEWDDLSGVVDLSAYRTAAAQDLIDATKQDTLVSGTNIKTVNSNSLLGSGNVDIDALPSQTGHSGEFLTTNGTTPSWAGLPDISVKANVSLDNLSSEGKNMVGTLSMPALNDTNWVPLTLGATGTAYTMTENGLVCFMTTGGTIGGYVHLYSGKCENLHLASQTYEVLRTFLFVPKGYGFAVGYGSAGTLTAFGYYKLTGNAV